MKRHAVIPTRGNRPFTLYRCLEAIGKQVDRVFLVDNSDWGFANDPAEQDTLAGLCQPAGITCIHDPQQPPNLSALWNRGLEAAGEDSLMHWVAVLNDDAIVPANWFGHLSGQMESAGAVAGGYNGALTKHTKPGVTALHERMPGHAFMLDGRYELRADEQFQWWCGDNDLDMQARTAGGTLILPDDPVVHMFPDRSTAENPVLQARTSIDMKLFVEKWGFRPWAV